MISSRRNTSDAYRPTLYDFIATEALKFYASGEQAQAKPEDAFEFRRMLRSSTAPRNSWRGPATRTGNLPAALRNPADGQRYADGDFSDSEGPPAVPGSAEVHQNDREPIGIHRC